MNSIDASASAAGNNIGTPTNMIALVSIKAPRISSRIKTPADTPTSLFEILG